MKIGTCRACGAKMLWAISINGHRQPFDPQPTPEGDFILVRRRPELEPTETPLALSITRLGLEGDGILAGGAATYIPHHATCPNREEFRKAA